MFSCNGSVPPPDYWSGFSPSGSGVPPPASVWSAPPPPPAPPSSTAKVTGVMWVPSPLVGAPLEGSYTTHFCGFTLQCSFKKGCLIAVSFDRSAAYEQPHNHIQVLISHPLPANSGQSTEPWQIAQQWHVELPSGNQVILEPHIWTLYDDTRFSPEQSSLGAFLARREEVRGLKETKFKKELGDLLWYVLPSLVASPLPFSPFLSQYGVLNSSPFPLHFYRKVWTQTFEEYVQLRRRDATTILEAKGLIIPTEHPIANCAFVELPPNVREPSKDLFNNNEVSGCVLKSNPEQFCGVILNPNSNPILYLRTDILGVNEAQKLWDSKELLVWPLDYSNYIKLVVSLERSVRRFLTHPNSEARSDAISTIFRPFFSKRLDASCDQTQYCSIDEVLTNLSRSKENVSVVIGPPGCGKTTLIQKAALEFIDRSENRQFNMLITSHANEPLRTLAYRMLDDQRLRNKFVLYQRGLVDCQVPTNADMDFFKDKILAVDDKFYRVESIEMNATCLNLFQVTNTTDYTERGEDKRWSLPPGRLINGFEVNTLPLNFPLANICSKHQILSKKDGFQEEASKIVLCTHLGLFSFLTLNRDAGTKEDFGQASRSIPFEFSQVFIDEGAQSPVSEVVMAAQISRLRLTQRQNTKVVLLGDPNQLRPYGYEPDQQSALELLRNKEGVKTYFLTTTYRLPEPLANLASEMFYHGKLKPAEGRKERFADVVNYIHVPGPHAVREGTSLVNKAQRVQASTQALLHLQQGKSVGIISFYRAEMEMLKRRFQETSVRVMTVDGCQGSESDVMILLTVNDFKGGPSDFSQDPNRFNVALTRAKEKLIVIGDRNALTSGDGDHIWKQFFTHFDRIKNS